MPLIHLSEKILPKRYYEVKIKPNRSKDIVVITRALTFCVKTCMSVYTSCPGLS